MDVETHIPELFVYLVGPDKEAALRYLDTYGTAFDSEESAIAHLDDHGLAWAGPTRPDELVPNKVFRVKVAVDRESLVEVTSCQACDLEITHEGDQWLDPYGDPICTAAFEEGGPHRAEYEDGE